MLRGRRLGRWGRGITVRRACRNHGTRGTRGCVEPRAKRSRWSRRDGERVLLDRRGSGFGSGGLHLIVSVWQGKCSNRVSVSLIHRYRGRGWNSLCDLLRLGRQWSRPWDVVRNHSGRDLWYRSRGRGVFVRLAGNWLCESWVGLR
jgi:hypothetical protein